MLSRSISVALVASLLAVNLSAQSPKLFKDIRPGNDSALPSHLTEFGGSFLFWANDGTHGTELWITNGTSVGTRLVFDSRPGSSSGGANDSIFVAGGTAYYAARDASSYHVLFKTNGVATVKLSAPSPQVPSQPWFASANGTVMFKARINQSQGYELYKTDGTPEGTVMVKDINPGLVGSDPTYITAIGNVVYFVARRPAESAELWRSDGTTDGTFLVKDIQKGIYGSTIREITRFGSRLLFVANDGTSGNELWISDGTAAGTQLVKDIRPGSANSTPMDLTIVGDRAFFHADDGTAGRELWITDGTTLGTRLVKDIDPGTSSSVPTEITPLGNGVVFAARNGTVGIELWKSDGTASGTTLVKDIRTGSQHSAPTVFASIGSRHAYFQATLTPTGREPWVTDGTTAGTRLVSDMYPGSSNSYPQAWHLSNGRLYFTANDGKSGAELWVLDPGATAQWIGTGCGAKSRVATMEATDPVLGKSMSIAGSGALPKSFGVTMLGLAQRPSLRIGLTDCHLYLALNGAEVVLAAFPVTTSTWAYGVNVPNDNTLVGVRIMLQSFFLGTDSVLGFDTTNGVFLTLGV